LLPAFTFFIQNINPQLTTPYLTNGNKKTKIVIFFIFKYYYTRRFSPKSHQRKNGKKTKTAILSEFDRMAAFFTEKFLRFFAKFAQIIYFISTIL